MVYVKNNIKSLQRRVKNSELEIEDLNELLNQIKKSDDLVSFNWIFELLVEEESKLKALKKCLELKLKGF